MGPAANGNPAPAMQVIQGLINSINAMLNQAGVPLPPGLAAAQAAQQPQPPPLAPAGPHPVLQQPPLNPPQQPGVHAAMAFMNGPPPFAGPLGPAPVGAPPIAGNNAVLPLGAVPAGAGLGLGQAVGNVRIQLLDNLLALMVQMPFGGTHLTIWDWKKGETIAGVGFYLPCCWCTR